MNITFVIQDISTRGGTERTTCCLANEMARNGHDVSILSIFHSEQIVYPLVPNVQVVYLTEKSYSLSLGIVRRLGLVFRNIARLKSCPLIQQADVIISQKFLASFMLFLAGKAHKTYAAEHFRYAMYSTPVRYLRNRIYHHFRQLVVLTEKDKQSFETHGGLRNVSVVPNMIPIQPIEWQGSNSKRIVSVGRLTYQKGFDQLLDAIARIKDRLQGYEFYIYGEGELSEELLQQQRQLGLTSVVHFHPFTQQIERVYQTAAFYVLSSRFEGFPMVLLESAACGVPIVSFDCPQGPAILLQNGGGLVVENGNTQALAEAILSLIQHPAQREQLHRQVLEAVVPYTPAKIYDRWMHLFQSATL